MKELPLAPDIVLDFFDLKKLKQIFLKRIEDLSYDDLIDSQITLSKSIQGSLSTGNFTENVHVLRVNTVSIQFNLFFLNFLWTRACAVPFLSDSE